MPSSLLYKLLTTCSKHVIIQQLGTNSANTTCRQFLNRFVTTCLQTCNNLCVLTCVGSDPDLTGFYKQRQEPITKCAAIARSRGYQLFAIQNGGMCLSGPKAQDTYKIHGLARNCKDGKGGEWANDVYIFNGKMKCFDMRLVGLVRFIRRLVAQGLLHVPRAGAKGRVRVGDGTPPSCQVIICIYLITIS
jgi:hypothetical protein